ncbi:MAG: nitroreductase family protein [Thermodesulfovibrionales bacterium]|nr:nitroreductase family protein [Thermodesulfovibrionales bacterium]
MDTVLNIIKERRSIRDFKDKEIPEEILSKLIEAIIWAPSAGNLQARKFFFVKNKEIKKRLATAALNQTFIAQAPLVIVGCLDNRIGRRYGERGIYLYAIQDVSCSIMNLMLVACENGLGTVWCGAFSETEVSSILKLPHNLRPIAIVPIGYPALIPKAPARLTEEEVIEYVL